MTQQNKHEQKKLLSVIMEADAKDGLYERQTAVEWLVRKLSTELIGEIPLHRWDEIRDAVQQAKQMEKDATYQTQAFWYGRGIAAAREDKIGEYAPKRENV